MLLAVFPETKSQEFFSKFSKKVLISCGFPVFGLLFKIDLAVRWLVVKMSTNHFFHVSDSGLCIISNFFNCMNVQLGCRSSKRSELI